MSLKDTCIICRKAATVGQTNMCKLHLLETLLGDCESRDVKQTTPSCREDKPVREVKVKSAAAVRRDIKYKHIKKIRGKTEFMDLENFLENVPIVPTNDITLCTNTTCGNKVMCFEYNGQIWKESRPSMNFNRDYMCVDSCKEIFGLQKIGMKRVLSHFKIKKINSGIKSWSNNWEKVECEEPVVYCVMDKITPGTEVGKIKKDIVNNREMLKEFVKIGVFRGIFRVSDFNGRNVLIGENKTLVSIDEGDIGKRLDIIGGRELWLIQALNKDKTIIQEILSDINANKESKINEIKSQLELFKFSEELFKEVVSNWENLENDLKSEGVEID